MLRTLIEDHLQPTLAVRRLDHVVAVEPQRLAQAEPDARAQLAREEQQNFLAVLALPVSREPLLNVVHCAQAFDPSRSEHDADARLRATIGAHPRRLRILVAGLIGYASVHAIWIVLAQQIPFKGAM